MKTIILLVFGVPLMIIGFLGGFTFRWLKDGFAEGSKFVQYLAESISKSLYK